MAKSYDYLVGFKEIHRPVNGNKFKGIVKNVRETSSGRHIPVDNIPFNLDIRGGTPEEAVGKMTDVVEHWLRNNP